MSGAAFAKKRKRALIGYAFHVRLWREFSTDIPQEHIIEWTTEVEAWEKDTSLPDPYFLAPSGKAINFYVVIVC